MATLVASLFLSPVQGAEYDLGSLHKLGPIYPKDCLLPYIYRSPTSVEEASHSNHCSRQLAPYVLTLRGFPQDEEKYDLVP